jgi:hypothetical protein
VDAEQVTLHDSKKIADEQLVPVKSALVFSQIRASSINVGDLNQALTG